MQLIGGVYYLVYADGTYEPAAKWQVEEYLAAQGPGGSPGGSGSGSRSGSGSGGGGAAAYEAPVGVASIEPAGYGYVKVTYTDGYSEIKADNSPEPTRFYDPNRTPIGYQPTYDTSGNATDYVDDPGYVSPYTTTRDTRSDFVNDRDYNYGVTLDDKNFAIDTRNYNRDVYAADRDYDYGVGRDVRADKVSDRNYGEDVRQFDALLAEDTAARQQDNERMYAEMASAEGQNAARIAGSIAENNARIASNENMARMDDATKRAIAAQQDKTDRRGQDVSQRGQNIGYMTDTRGQDIGREANITGAVGDYYGTIGAMQNNPVKQAMLVTGVDYGTTPLEHASNEYRDYITKLRATQRFVGAAPAAPAMVAAARGAVIRPDMIETGDGRVLRTPPDARVKIRVGEEGPEIADTHRNERGELVLDRVIPHDGPARFGAAAGVQTRDGVRPVRTVGAQPRNIWNGTAWVPNPAVRGTPVGDEGGSGRGGQGNNGAPAPRQPLTQAPGYDMRYQGLPSNPPADPTTRNQFTRYEGDPLANFSEEQLRAAKIKIMWNGGYQIKGPAGFWVKAERWDLQEAVRRMQGQTPAGRAQPNAGVPATPPAGIPAGGAPPAGTPPAGTPPGGTPPDTTVDALKEVMKGVLGDIVSGKPEIHDYPTAKVYDTDIGRPQDYAYTYDTFGGARKATTLDAMNVGYGFSEDEFERQRRMYKPAALTRAPIVGYG